MPYGKRTQRAQRNHNKNFPGRILAWRRKKNNPALNHKVRTKYWVPCCRTKEAAPGDEFDVNLLSNNEFDIKFNFGANLSGEVGVGHVGGVLACFAHKRESRLLA